MKRRLKREDPDRLGPIRSWETLFRPTEPNGDAADNSSSATDATAKDQGSWEDIANRAIEQGYQVIEEQIRQGQRVAEQFRGYSQDIGKVNNDVSRLVERSMRFYADVGSLWFELIESLVRNPALASNDRHRIPDTPKPNGHENSFNGNGAHPTFKQDVEIEVSSRSPASVALDLKAPASPSLAVPALRALDQSKPPLTEIRFEHGANRPVLRIRIPPEQPADTYAGAIIDTRTSEPQGTLCITIRNEDAPS